MTFDLTIAICTYKRERLLARALQSLIAAQPATGLSFEVVVVDNSEDGCAREVIGRLSAQARAAPHPFSIRAIDAQPANISVARNAAVGATRSTWLAFVDDDQQFAADWLIQASLAIADGSFDVWFGAVEPEFETPQRTTPRARALFTRSLSMPQGSALIALGRDKTPGIALATGNALFKRATTLRGRLFDPAFGAGGGEDYDLFCRLERDGRRFGWRPSLRVAEFLPASRCDPAYLRRRFFAGGQAFALAAAGSNARPGLARWWLRAKAVVQAGLLAAAAPRVAFAGRAALTDYSYSWAGVLGKLSFGELYALYRTSSGGKPKPRQA